MSKNLKYYLTLIFCILVPNCNKPSLPEIMPNQITSDTSEEQKTHVIFLRELKQHGIKILESEEPIHDWGKYFFSQQAKSYQVIPKNIRELQMIVKLANKYQIPLRVRGKGHSMNSSSLPRNNEILILTEKFRHLRPINADIVEIGSGISVAGVNEYLRNFGYELHIYNDGSYGPSIGGFISSGGLAIPSEKYGGFWENVEEITIVDGLGNVQTIPKSHPDFRWFFGSMGQLGIITAAVVKITKNESSQSKPIPYVKYLTEPYEEKESHLQEHKNMYKNVRLYWYTVMAPVAEKEKLLKELLEIKNNFKNLFYWNPEYIWPIKFINFNPPLVYPWQEEFVAIGIWGYNTPKNPFNPQKIAELEVAINELVQKYPKYKRYIQSELTLVKLDYEIHLGKEVLREFRKIKEKYDPHFLINRNFYLFNSTAP